MGDRGWFATTVWGTVWRGALGRARWVELQWAEGSTRRTAIHGLAWGIGEIGRNAPMDLHGIDRRTLDRVEPPARGFQRACLLDRHGRAFACDKA